MFGKKKLKQQIEKVESEWKARLEASERSADELSELAAQELRTPLVRMQKLLQESLENSHKAEELKSTLQNLLTELSEYKSVIDELFIITRTNLYKEPGLFVPIDLTQATKEVAEKFVEKAKAKEIDYQLSLDETFTHPAHPTYYRKMVSILIDNAIKYTPNKGTVHISLHREKNNLVLLVEDTGYGMEPQEVSKALKRFHRLERSRREGIAGHGLGLSIAQWIARLHQTDLDISSMTGKGSRFQVLFSLKN